MRPKAKAKESVVHEVTNLQKIDTWKLFFICGPHLVVLWGYSWPGAQEPSLGGVMWSIKIKPRSAARNASAPPTALSLWPRKLFLTILEITVVIHLMIARALLGITIHESNEAPTWVQWLLRPYVTLLSRRAECSGTVPTTSRSLHTRRSEDSQSLPLLSTHRGQ